MEIILFEERINDFEKQLPDAQEIDGAEKLKMKIESLRTQAEALPNNHPLKFRWAKLWVAILIRLGRLYIQISNRTKPSDYFKLADSENMRWKQKFDESFQLDFKMLDWKIKINNVINKDVTNELYDLEKNLLALNDEIEESFSDVSKLSDDVFAEIYDMNAIIKNEILFSVAMPYFEQENKMHDWEPKVLDIVNKLTFLAEKQHEGHYILSPLRLAEIWINCGEALNRMGQRDRLSNHEFERAISFLDKLEELADVLDINILVNGRIQKAEIYTEQNKFEDAMTLLHDVQKESELDNLSCCSASYYLGSVYEKQGKTGQASEMYQQAWEIYKLSPDEIPDEFKELIETALKRIEQK